MAELSIVQYPDSRLREECEPIQEITDEVRALLDDMAETMYAAPGIGLAGPQIGDCRRLVVIDVGEPNKKLYKLINPEIVNETGTVNSEEGCLSIPDVRETIKRAEQVVVQALDENGDNIEIEADGLLALCLQHEIDHLDGVLFIDHLSKLKKQLVRSKLNKLKAQR